MLATEKLLSPLHSNVSPLKLSKGARMEKRFDKLRGSILS